MISWMLSHNLIAKLRNDSIADVSIALRYFCYFFFEFLDFIWKSRPPIIVSFDKIFWGVGTIFNKILAPVNKIWKWKFNKPKIKMFILTCCEIDDRSACVAMVDEMGSCTRVFIDFFEDTSLFDEFIMTVPCFLYQFFHFRLETIFFLDA